MNSAAATVLTELSHPSTPTTGLIASVHDDERVRINGVNKAIMFKI